MQDGWIGSSQLYPNMPKHSIVLITVVSGAQSPFNVSSGRGCLLFMSSTRWAMHALKIPFLILTFQKTGTTPGAKEL